jgi:hypothetical protein
MFVMEGFIKGQMPFINPFSFRKAGANRKNRSGNNKAWILQ